MRRLAAAFLVAATACIAHAEVLYAVTLRNYANASTGGLGGSLYTVDTDTGTARIVAPLRLKGQPIGLRGVAIHPKTRVFYGITAGLAANIARSLVTIEPHTGNATLIGSLGITGSDINFDAKGTLYIWLTDLNQLGTVDLGTGVAKPIADSGITQTIGGGFAIDAKGHALLSATSAAGTLDTVDLETGRVATGPHLVGAPFVSAITAMDFAPNGHDLYAVNSNLGAPSSAALVRIDPTSGVVKAIGMLPNDTSAVTFGVESDVGAGTVTVRMWTLVGLALVAVGAIAFALYASVKARKG